MHIDNLKKTLILQFFWWVCFAVFLTFHLLNWLLSMWVMEHLGKEVSGSERRQFGVHNHCCHLCRHRTHIHTLQTLCCATAHGYMNYAKDLNILGDFETIVLLILLESKLVAVFLTSLRSGVWSCCLGRA